MGPGFRRDDERWGQERPLILRRLAKRGLEERTTSFLPVFGEADQLSEIVGCHPTELSTPQNNRARAAAFSRRCRSRSLRYSSNAARSAAVTEAWVGTTHAVGQRVTPFVRMYSSMTVSQLASGVIRIDVSVRTEAMTGNASRLPDSDISSLQPS